MDLLLSVDLLLSMCLLCLHGEKNYCRFGEVNETISPALPDYVIREIPSWSLTKSWVTLESFYVPPSFCESSTLFLKKERELREKFSLRLSDWDGAD